MPRAVLRWLMTPMLGTGKGRQREVPLTIGVAQGGSGRVEVGQADR